MHISSGRSRAATPYKVHYCTSKAALAMLADCMQLEFQEDDISVGYMEPGWTNTPMVNGWISKTYTDPNVRARIRNEIVVKSKSEIFNSKYEVNHCQRSPPVVTGNVAKSRECGQVKGMWSRECGHGNLVKGMAKFPRLQKMKISTNSFSFHSFPQLCFASKGTAGMFSADFSFRKTVKLGFA